MVSVVSACTADRIAARSFSKLLRAAFGTPARYSSTFFGAALPFAAELRLPVLVFFMHARPPALISNLLRLRRILNLTLAETINQVIACAHSDRHHAKRGVLARRRHKARPIHYEQILH